MRIQARAVKKPSNLIAIDLGHHYIGDDHIGFDVARFLLPRPSRFQKSEVRI